jgi:hypothetical protein
MKKFLGISSVIIVLVLALIIYWNYYNIYSTGERKGLLIKVTYKGNLFKTNEGEMWLSCRQLVNPEKFLFSIQDKALADSLSNIQDQCVELEYKQFRSSIPWRGESTYVVVGYKKVIQ